jgi:hypothetical protein
MAVGPVRYRWAAPGDLNAFFGLMLDNVMNLVILAGILIGVFGFPRDVVYTRMFPGTALGVLFGDLVYTWMAFRLARREGRDDVTAMPLGLDAPSTIGMAFAVLGPAFLNAKTRLPEHEAAIEAYVGYKIRAASLQKLPYVAVVGEREAEAGGVNIRSRERGELGAMRVEEFLTQIATERYAPTPTRAAAAE